jgi:hypothetical protein
MKKLALLTLLAACAHMPAPLPDLKLDDCNARLEALEKRYELPREDVVVPYVGVYKASFSYPSNAAKTLLAQPAPPGFYTATGATVGLAVMPVGSCIGLGGALPGESCTNSGAWTIVGASDALRIYYGNQVRLTNSIASGAWITPYAFETSAAVTAITMTDANGTARVAWTGPGLYINASGGTFNFNGGGVTIASGGLAVRNSTGNLQVGDSGNAYWVADTAAQVETTSFIAYRELPTAITIPDNANGGTAAAYTSTFAESDASVSLTCADAQGCNVTLTETSILDGQRVCYVNVGANTINFADTAGVSEIAGAFAAGTNDSICLQYRTNTWVELSRSNN